MPHALIKTHEAVVRLQWTGKTACYCKAPGVLSKHHCCHDTWLGALPTAMYSGYDAIQPAPPASVLLHSLILTRGNRCLRLSALGHATVRRCYLGDGVEDGMESVAQHMRCVPLGRARIVQHLDGEVEVCRTQVCHHSHQNIPGIIPATTRLASVLAHPCCSTDNMHACTEKIWQIGINMFGLTCMNGTLCVE